MSEKLALRPEETAVKETVMTPGSAAVFDRLADFIANPDKKPLMTAASYGDFIADHYHYFRQIRTKQRNAPVSHRNRFESQTRRSLATTYSRHLVGAIKGHDQSLAIHRRSQSQPRPLPVPFLVENADDATFVVCGLGELVANGVRIKLLPQAEFNEADLGLDRYFRDAPLLLSQLLVDNQANLAHFWLAALDDCTDHFSRLDESLRSYLIESQTDRDHHCQNNLSLPDDI